MRRAPFTFNAPKPTQEEHSVVESPIELRLIPPPPDDTKPAPTLSVQHIPRPSTTSPSAAEKKFASTLQSSQRRKVDELRKNTTVHEHNLPRGVSSVRSTVSLPKLSQYVEAEHIPKMTGPELVDNKNHTYHADRVSVDMDVLWNRALVHVAADFFVEHDTNMLVLCVPIEDGVTVQNAKAVARWKVEPDSVEDEVREFETLLAARRDGRGLDVDKPVKKAPEALLGLPGGRKPVDTTASAEKFDIMFPSVFRFPLSPMFSETRICVTYSLHVVLPFAELVPTNTRGGGAETKQTTDGCWQLSIPLLGGQKDISQALQNFTARCTFNSLCCNWLAASVPLIPVRAEPPSFVAVQLNKAGEFTSSSSGRGTTSRSITVQFGVTLKHPPPAVLPRPPATQLQQHKTQQIQRSSSPPPPTRFGSNTTNNNNNSDEGGVPQSSSTLFPLSSSFAHEVSTRSSAGTVLFEKGSNGFTTYAMLVTPPQVEVPYKRNILLLIDISRSMRVIMQQLVKTLTCILNDHMVYSDMLDVILFGSSIHVLNGALKPISAEHVNQTVLWLQSKLMVGLEDGTRLDKAVKTGLQLYQPCNTETGINHMFIITDGCTKQDHAVYKMFMHSRIDPPIHIHTFAIGPFCNVLFQSSLSLHTGGQHYHCLTLPNLDSAFKCMFDSTKQCVVNELKVGIKPDTGPASGFRLSSLFVGRPSVAFARYKGSEPESVQVSGLFARCNTTHKYECTPALVKYNPFLHKGLTMLSLLCDYFTHFSNCTSWVHPENVPETVEFSLGINFPTTHTCLMAFEPSLEEKKIRHQTAERHEGVKHADIQLCRLHLASGVRLLHQLPTLGSIKSTEQNVLTHQVLDDLVWRGLSPPWHDMAYQQFAKQCKASNTWLENIANHLYTKPTQKTVKKRQDKTFGRLAMPTLKLIFVDD